MKLREFGLGSCDLSTMLWNVNFFLRMLTLNIDVRFNKKIPVIFYVITAVVTLGYMYVYLVSMVWFVFWRCQETGDLVAAMVVFSLGVSSEIGTSKLFYMFLYEDIMRDVVGEYLACDALVVHGSRFSRNLLKTLKHVKRRAIIFWCVIIGNGVIYIMIPLLTPGRHTMEDDFIIFGLEPMFESPNYEVALFLTMLGVIYTCYLPANITAFLIVLIGYTEATMLALSEDLINLWSDAQQDYKKKYLNIDTSIGTNDYIDNNNDKQKNDILNQFVKERLGQILKIHRTNINLIRQIEHVFRGAIAFEFLLLTIGLIAELLGGLENTYIEMPYALMQVAMDCFTGQRMIDACLIFESSVYDCKWENFNVSNMKTVLLILQNAQKTLKLSAGGMATLSFSCLMTIIRTIYSAYTALQSTMAFT